MDSEWVGRAGILAEAVSFILIAPEILGKDRLEGAEEALERWLQGSRATVAIGLPVVAVTAVLVGIYADTVFDPHDIPVPSFILPFAVPISMAAFITLCTVLIRYAAIGLVGAARQLLAGEDRLRVLVFGTGVVLLFGGLGAQFWASF